MRWLAAGGIVLAAAVAAGPLAYPVPLVKLALLGVGVAVFNALLAAVYRRVHGGGGDDDGHQGRRLANAQITLDLGALAVLIHLSGGINNPFAIYLVFHMIIAGILLPPSHAYAQATLAAALYSGVVFGEHWGRLPHVPIFLGRGPLATLDVAAQVGVIASALYIAVFLTVTVSRKLRQRERELARALDEVERHAVACDLARDALQWTQEMQLQYMRRVSHELRAPLSSINMTLRVIRDAMAGQAPEKLQNLMGRAEARTETLLDTVDDLLTLSRLRQAPLQEPMVEVAVAHLVEQVTDAVRDAAEQQSVDLRVEVAAGLPPLHGQPEGLRTALDNLVGNAVKYTPPGGSVTVRAALAEDGSRVLITVADTGIGVAPADLPRLFDEFFRTEAARTLQVHGSGLGLAIVKAIVTAHGGEVAVESEVGRGTTFTMSLPPASEAEPTPVES